MIEVISAIAVVWSIVSVVVVGCCVSAAHADRDARADVLPAVRPTRLPRASQAVQRFARSTRPAA